jgi:23S rRNA pseudouridine1911/1915/1917 synthase
VEQGPTIISTPPQTPQDTEDEPELLALGAEQRSARVQAPEHGQRLDKALGAIAGEFSRSYLQQLIDGGAVQVNGQTVTKNAHKLKAFDLLTIDLQPTAQSQAFRPEAMDIALVYQDEDIFVVNKPAGLVVHPAPGHWSGTLLNGLLHLDPGLASVPRAGIVHRLDKDTSGLMVVARNRLAMDALVHAIAARTMHRRYLAWGHKPWELARQRTVEAPIGRDPRNRLRMAVVDLAHASGKTAKTDFFFLANSPTACLVRCVLHTGRTHQIRVHMGSLGHPLLGDAVYGGHQVPGLERQALHAYSLAFAQPQTGEPLAFAAPPPADLQALLAQWGLSYNGLAL